MRLLLMVVFAIVAGIATASPWGYWEACRHQYDRTAQLCANSVQCGPNGACDLRTGTCIFPTMEQDAIHALQCASSSSPHALWSIPLSSSPHIGLVTDVGTLTLSPQPPTGTPLLPGQVTACQADPLVPEPTDEPCRAEAHSFCGRRYGATGRCAHIGTRGRCYSKVPPHSSACTGRGGTPVEGRYDECAWPQYHTQTECLNHMCHPRFQAKHKGKYICPMYCYDRKFTTKAHCLRHFKGKPMTVMQGWDEVLGRCRVECSTCLRDFDKAGKHAATHLGTCARSDVWVWHPPQFNDQASCLDAGAHHEQLADPPMPGEECPYRGLPPGDPCPSSVNTTITVEGCLFPYVEGRGPPFLAVSVHGTPMHWLPDVSPEQCATLDTPGTWATWNPPHRPAGELSPLAPLSLSSGAEWCNASLVQGQMPLSPEQQAARRQWIAATAVALTVAEITAQDVAPWHHSTWTAEAGSWTAEEIPFALYWSASPATPILMRIAVTQESAQIYALNITQGLDHRIPDPGALPYICHPQSFPGSLPIEGHGQCIQMPHHTGHWNATQTPTRNSPATQSTPPTQPPPPTSSPSSSLLPSLADQLSSQEAMERHRSRTCPEPGFLWPECTERVCGKWTPEEPNEVRGITVNGQCQCDDAYWDGPECNHCAVPKLEEPHLYVCAQIPPYLLPKGTAIRFARVPVHITAVRGWLHGTNGIQGYPGLKNYAAGTMGFDCKCRHYREEYDQRHSNAEDMHRHHEARGAPREVPLPLYARALPLNETEQNITSACLQLAGVDQASEDAILALLAGETPAGIECRRSLSSEAYLLLIVVCVLMLVGMFLLLSNMCSRETASEYNDEILDEDAMLEDEKQDIKSSVTMASSTYRPSARRRIPSSTGGISD